MKAVLKILAVILILVGSLLLAFTTLIGMIDTNSVTVLLSEDRMGSEILSEFTFTPWRQPSGRIKPFEHRTKSFKDCKILRYRRGFWPHWMIWRTYYEAEYLKPDGSKVIGPAFGPLPYSAPNLLVSIPVIASGIVMLIIAVKSRSRFL